MYFLSRIVDLCIDFLFPKSRKVLELEALSIDTIIKTLPPANFARSKDSFVESKAECQKNKDIIALFDYSHPVVKEIVWKLKYNGNARIADKLGEILYDHIQQEFLDLALFEKWGRPILIPIPISDKRRFERGWNQSELLCEQIMAHDNEKTFRYLPRRLVKLYHTESQTKTSSRSERLKNIKNSMKVLNAPAIIGECIVVLDDVTTTGSTFVEAKRVLHAAGAKKILCVAVAH